MPFDRDRRHARRGVRPPQAHGRNFKQYEIFREGGQTVQRLVIEPIEGQPALIFTLYERAVEGIVERVSGDRLELAVETLPLDHERRWARGVFIEFAVDTGVYRTRTRVVDVTRRGHGFVVTMETRARESLLLTRTFVRAPLALPARVKRDGTWRRTTTVDVAGGGVRLPFEIGAEVGDLLRLEIENVPPFPVLVASGRVVRETPDGGFGVAFTEIGDEERAALMALAFAHRRTRSGALPDLVTA